MVDSLSRIDLQYLVDARDASQRRRRALADAVGPLVSAATSIRSGVSVETDLACSRKTRRSSCSGKLMVCRLDVPTEIRWHCPECQARGVIVNWRGTPWDSSARRRPPSTGSRTLSRGGAGGEDGLDRLARRLSSEPLRELAGLSFDQVGRLVEAGVDAPEGPLGLNRRLTRRELGRVPILIAARRHLQALQEAEESGRSGVGRSRSSAEDRALRALLELAGLVRKERRRFRLTGQGALLLTDARVGELYAALFRSCFFRLNPRRSNRSFHAWIPFSLYALGRGASIWRNVDALVPELLLPVLRKELGGEAGGSLEEVIERDFLVPLERFGLVDLRSTRRGSKRYRQARKTRLFDRFLRFRI